MKRLGSRNWLRSLFLALPLACISNACVRLQEPTTYSCESNSDCDDNQKCLGGVCRARSYCQADYHCGQLERCEHDACVAIECIDNENLDDACGAYKCNRDHCLQVCAGNADCQDNAHCELGECVPGSLVQNDEACTTADECRSGKCCPTPAGLVCASDCGEGRRCTSAKDCATGICCVDGSGSSYSCSLTACTSCVKDQECEDGQICEDSRCVKPLRATGQSCTVSADCNSGLCRSGHCSDLGANGYACAADEDCVGDRHCCAKSADASTKVCSTESGDCLSTIGGKCDTKRDCAAAALCSKGSCSKSCETNADCGNSPAGPENVCVSGWCRAGCNDISDCTRLSAGTYCSSGYCH